MHWCVQDQDDAVERERAAAAARLREACERYEQQLQAQRLRLVSDSQLQLEAAAASTREERRRAEEAAAAAADALKVREAQLREEHARDLEARERQHARAVDEVRQAAADTQEAWRAALVDKLRREAAEAEHAVRARLTKERDEEVEVRHVCFLPRAVLWPASA
jgi:hypothetical protein